MVDKHSHTPVPWEVQAIHDESVEIIDPTTGRRIALADGQTSRNEANAAFIAHAINAYPLMLSRLKACVISLECFKRDIEDTHGALGGRQYILVKMLANDIALAKEVVAKAGGLYGGYKKHPSARNCGNNGSLSGRSKVRLRVAAHDKAESRDAVLLGMHDR